MSDLEQLHSLVRAYLEAMEAVEICRDRRGIRCDEDECEPCGALDKMLDARLALQMWMKEHSP